MKKFDPYEIEMEESVSTFLEQAEANFDDGSTLV